MHSRPIVICATVIFFLFTLANSNVMQASGKSAIQKRRATSAASQGSRGIRSRRSRIAEAPGAASCSSCAAQVAAKSKTRSSKRGKVTARNLPCHPKNYVDPKIARNYKAALRDMKRAGITPKITSAWRSSDTQAQLRRCSLSTRCRGANPGLYRALPAGKSLHEAGFAVDIGGVATGPRGDKQLTPKGRRIVGIMRKNGFAWRYGLSDPAHFEANPKRYGYRSAEQAIARTQTTCQVRLARNKTHKKAAKTIAARRAGASMRTQLRAESRVTKGQRRAKARA